MNAKNRTQEILSALNEIDRYQSSIGQYEREKQKFIYVDPLKSDPVINKLLDVKKRYKIKFLVGRRGTGKTTIVNRAIIEGYDSFLNKDKLEYWSNERELKFVPIYINIKSLLQKIQDLIEDDIVDSIAQFSKKIFIQVTKKIQNFFEQINREDNTIITKNCLKLIEENNDVFIKNLEKEVSERRKTIGHKLLIPLKKVFSAIKGIEIKDFKIDIDYEYLNQNWIKIFPIDLLLDALRNLIQIIPTIDFFYIFIDDFSELNENIQEIIINGIISPIYSDSENMYLYFCINCYPALYSTGNLSIGDECDIIDLDWFKMYQNAKFQNNLTIAIEFMKAIINKRVSFYLSEEKDSFKLSDIFDETEDIYSHLYFATMNVPRFLGKILRTNECRRIILNSRQIRIKNIIEASKKLYNDQLVLNYFGNKKYFNEELVLYDQELWNWLISKFRDKNYRNKIAVKAQGFFFIDEELFEKLNPILIRLEMMGFLFKLANFKSKHKYSVHENRPEDIRLQALYSIYYGAAKYYNLSFPVQFKPRDFRERDSAYHFTDDLLRYQEKKEYYECPICKYKVQMINSQYLVMSNFNCARTDECREKKAKYRKIFNPSSYKFTEQDIKNVEKELDEENDVNLKENLKIYKKHRKKYNKMNIEGLPLLILITLYENPGEFLTAKEISKTRRITPYEYSSQKIAQNIRRIGTSASNSLCLVDSSNLKRNRVIYKIKQKGIEFIEYLKSEELITGIY